MSRSKLKPTLEDAFAIGKLEGQKEALTEVNTLIKEGLSLVGITGYIKSKLAGLNSNISNPFKKTK